MFGYFDPRNSKSYSGIRPKYRRFYCSTCKAIEYNYGCLSKPLLSYDIALLAMVMNLDISNSKVSRFPCPFYCGSFKGIKNNEDWKKIAALNLLLFAQKLNDDILDDNSALAKTLVLVYGRSIKRATRDFPVMAKEISEGYLRIVEDEEQCADAGKIALDFSKMMVLAVSSYLMVTEQQRKFISAISSWVYIIDALDDYDKDAKKKLYNPFVEEGVRFDAYLNSHREDIAEMLADIFANCLTYDDDQFDYASADILLNQFIPDVTQKVLCGVSLKLVHLKAAFCERRLCLPREEF